MTKGTEAALAALKEHIKEIYLLGSISGILGWDERTYMPRQGAAHRANQLAYLSGMIHEKLTDPRVGDWLSQIEGTDVVADPLTPDAVTVRELRRAYDKQTKVPKELVEKITYAETIGQGIWVEARKESDFGKFLPQLEKMIDLKGQYAEAVGYDDVPYDALLDDYEPGVSTKEVAAVFARFRKELVELVKKITSSKKKPDVSIIERDYPVDRQHIFGQAAATAIGFDLSAGRLDITDHPFCSGTGPGDCRITTRYNPNHFGQAFFGILHEAGHGMYEQGLPTEHFGTPMCDSVSLGIHESQSRMWENMVGRSRPFWECFFPRAQQVFHTALAGVDFDDFYFAINDVRPSFIRVEADEVSYGLHIMLRFEIEQEIFDGKIKPSELNAVWNDKFTSYFGITPRNDAEGCLQDIHWSAGLFGYFPTYALGNLYAAQFFAKAKEDIGDLDEQFAAGRFDELLSWLRKHIHSQGQRYRANKLVEVVTGKPLGHELFMTYLKDKFSPLYGL
ncbi:MAG: carboxypeptidase M32 [candidate division Zixibacteria bacterium]|nr:carboxypeptidase M32 [candidate division Zixibacteria bacterium]